MPTARRYNTVRSNTPVYVKGHLLRNFANDPTYRKWQAIKNGTSHRVRAFNVNPMNNKTGRIKKLFAFYIALNNKRNNATLNKLYLDAFGAIRRNRTGMIIMPHRHQLMFFPGNRRPRPLNVRRPPRLII